MNNIETMKLALEALELSHPRFGVGTAIHIKAVATLRQAIEKCLANDALEKKAENARELGLDYEPVATNDTSQERVDEMLKQRHEPCGLECDCTDVCKQENYKALWQQMCERCDELDKGLAQRTWVGLTEEERQDIALEVPMDAVLITEAKLKEKNT